MYAYKIGLARFNYFSDNVTGQNVTKQPVLIMYIYFKIVLNEYED